MNRHALAVRLDWLHSLIQELEHQGIELPMGDYNEVYGIIEDVREAFLDD